MCHVVLHTVRTLKLLMIKLFLHVCACLCMHTCVCVCMYIFMSPWRSGLQSNPLNEVETQKK